MATIKHVSVAAKQLSGYKIEGQARDHRIIIDQPPVFGGQDSGPSPVEYLLVSLAGCIVTVADIIARQRKLDVRDIQVRIEGELDLDKLLDIPTEQRPGFKGLQVYVHIDADLTLAEKEQFLKDLDARCPISDNLRNLTPIELVVDPLAVAAQAAAG